MTLEKLEKANENNEATLSVVFSDETVVFKKQHELTSWIEGVIKLFPPFIDRFGEASDWLNQIEPVKELLQTLRQVEGFETKGLSDEFSSFPRAALPDAHMDEWLFGPLWTDNNFVGAIRYAMKFHPDTTIPVEWLDFVQNENREKFAVASREAVSEEFAKDVCKYFDLPEEETLDPNKEVSAKKNEGGLVELSTHFNQSISEFQREVSGLREQIHSFLVPLDKERKGFSTKAQAALERQTAELEKIKEQMFTDLKSIVTKRVNELNDAHEQYKTRLSEMEAERATEAVRHVKRMKDLETAAEGQVLMEASDRMWEERYEEHATLAKRWLITLIVCLIGAAIGIIPLFKYYKEQQDLFAVSAKGVDPVSTTILIGTGLLAFWILRTIANEFKRNRSLADDAMERTTMIKTFKAFEYHGDAGQEERFLILDRLFRPRVTKEEDALPHPLWDAVRQRANTMSRSTGGTDPS